MRVSGREEKDRRRGNRRWKTLVMTMWSRFWEGRKGQEEREQEMEGTGDDNVEPFLGGKKIMGQHSGTVQTLN